MKKNNTWNKLIIFVLLIPVIPIIFLDRDVNIITLNQISNGIISNILISIFIVYTANLVYRLIYLEDEKRKFIFPLLFLFIMNVFSFLIFFTGAIPALKLINIDMSTTTAICFYVAVVTFAIQALAFELHSYGQSGKTDIKECLIKANKETLLPDLLMMAVIIITIAIPSINDISVLKDFGLLIPATLWNFLFTRLIRPQLFTTLKDE